MLLMIDNYDSFTYNLVQYLGELGAEVLVHRHDAIDVAGIAALDPTHLVVSPGPKTPDEAGISVDAIREQFWAAFDAFVPGVGVLSKAS